ncbi:MAG: hypothetical protein KZQ83_00455 [gamma proteobacterium symbiont of Taylorina sp.]|nr:hypothetical protein [gamma proteobacterium symbiont of Taylorina sp.]
MKTNKFQLQERFSVYQVACVYYGIEPVDAFFAKDINELLLVVDPSFGNCVYDFEEHDPDKIQKHSDLLLQLFDDWKYKNTDREYAGNTKPTFEDYRAEVLSREYLENWFDSKGLDCPEILLPRKSKITELKEENEQLKHKNKELQDKLNKQIEDNKAIQNEPPKGWRAAFEYKSDGLDALYDLIEKFYFDSEDKPIYDIKLLPQKKKLSSEWLAPKKGRRTLDEVDTIITSRKRKGINDK